tara:strand:- start:877 stop:1071 length:195 start_codon:yes stop_codon:yes gene_type:complete
LYREEAERVWSRGRRVRLVIGWFFFFTVLISNHIFLVNVLSISLLLLDAEISGQSIKRHNYEEQ